MGEGAFGSNGSVHWIVKQGTTMTGTGVDDSKRHPGKPGDTQYPDNRPVIGADEHAGTFRVTARYPTGAAAEAALRDINNRFKTGNTELVLLVDVRAYQSPVGPENRWEVTVDW